MSDSTKTLVAIISGVVALAIAMILAAPFIAKVILAYWDWAGALVGL